MKSFGSVESNIIFCFKDLFHTPTLHYVSGLCIYLPLPYNNSSEYNRKREKEKKMLVRKKERSGCASKRKQSL